MNDTMGPVLPPGVSVAPGVTQSDLVELLSEHARQLIGVTIPGESRQASALRAVVLVGASFVVGDDGPLPVAFGASLTDGNEISRGCLRKLAQRLRMIADGLEKEAP